MNHRTPRTPADWQEAVNAAEACLLIDSARQYGLIIGGPSVHVARCRAILARGQARGVEPNRAGVDAYIAALASGDGSGRSTTAGADRGDV